jgi:hypothetical protein
MELWEEQKKPSMGRAKEAKYYDIYGGRTKTVEQKGMVMIEKRRTNCKSCWKRSLRKHTGREGKAEDRVGVRFEVFTA